MKFCAQRGCQVPIKASDVLCPCCNQPLADDGTTKTPPPPPPPPPPAAKKAPPKRAR